MNAEQTGSGTDAELLASKDSEDFGVFYSRHVAAVTVYVARRVAGPEASFDLVAETFARALEHRGAYASARGPAIAWLIGIARHLIADAARRGRVDAAARRRLGMAPVSLDDEQLAVIELRGRLEFADALAALPPEQREAVIRRVLSEEPYELLAARFDCSEQVVRKRVSRGLAQLRRSMEADKP